MAKYIYTILGLFSSLLLNAQTAEVINTESTSSGIITISYRLSPVYENYTYSTSIEVSVDGGKTFMPLKSVTGDVGTLKPYPTGVLKAEWNVLKDVDELNGDVVFRVVPQSKKIPLPAKRLIAYCYTPSAPFGITLISYRRMGGYVRFKSNFVFGTSDYEASEEGLTNYPDNGGYWKIGSQERTIRYGYTGGFVFKLRPKFLLTLGAGYGLRELQWEYEAYTSTDAKDKSGYAKVTESSYKGIEAELGAVLYLSKRFAMTAGANTINFNFWEFNVGLGYGF